MHKAVKTAVAGVAAAIISMSAANAAEPLVDAKMIPGEFSANVGIWSEYYFRGISQTDDAPALQGGFDWSAKLDEKMGLGIYFGTWGSNVDFNEAAGIDGATLELDVYGGLTGEIGSTGIGWDVGFIQYLYPGAAGSLNYDFLEGKVALSYDFGFVAATASVNYSGNYYGASGESWYPKLALEAPVGKYLTVTAMIAKQYVEKNAVFLFPDYTEYGLGASVNIAGFDVGVTYSDTSMSHTQCPEACGGKVLFNVSRSF